MKILVILAHPNFGRSTINKRLHDELQKYPEIEVRNLYQMYSDWDIDVDAEQNALLKADRIVFQFPLYWYNVTPLLKKYFDDVFEYGFGYGSKGDKLNGKDFMVATTVGGPKDVYQAGARNNYTISELMRPLQQSASLTGMNYKPIFTIHGTIYFTKEENKVELDNYAHEYIFHIKNENL